MEEVKKRYPYLTRDERRMPDDFPSITLGGPFGKFFPLQIVNCNGNYAKAFSEAEVFVKGFPDPGTNYYLLCIADAQLYMGITYELLYRPNKQAEERRTKALTILEHFFADKGRKYVMILTLALEFTCVNTVSVSARARFLRFDR